MRTNRAARRAQCGLWRFAQPLFNSRIHAIRSLKAQRSSKRFLSRTAKSGYFSKAPVSHTSRLEGICCAAIDAKFIACSIVSVLIALPFCARRSRPPDAVSAARPLGRLQWRQRRSSMPSTLCNMNRSRYRRNPSAPSQRECVRPKEDSNKSTASWSYLSTPSLGNKHHNASSGLS
jgi:hypothetical protein